MKEFADDAYARAILGSRLLVGEGNTAQVWRVPGFQPAGPPIVQRSHWGRGHVRGAFHPDGRRVLTVLDNKARLRDIATAVPLSDPTILPEELGSPVFSEDGSTLVMMKAVGEESPGYVKIWDTETGRVLLSFGETPTDFPENEDEFDRVQSCLSEDGRRLGIPMKEGVRVYDLPGAGTAVPGWLAEVAEAMGGQSLNEVNAVEKLSGERRFATLTKIAQELAAQPGADGWSTWGRWLLSTEADPLVSPSAGERVSEYVEARLAEGDTAALELAGRAAPANPRLYERLAKAYKALGKAAGSEAEAFFDKAEFWVRSARALAPEQRE